MSKKIYIDTNIFVTLFLKRDGCERIEEFFENKLKDSSLIFCTSDWTITELVKVLVTECNVEPERVAAYTEALSRGRRICGVRFEFVDVSPENGYDFGEFFYNVQSTVLEYKNGFQDAIHSAIMRNNGIDLILTLDAGFEGVEGIEVVNPLRV